jgi:uncharacterized protein YkwD
MTPLLLPTTAALALGAALLLSRPALALPQEELLDLVNELRLEECSRPADTPLEADPALDAVARAYADDGSLQQALESRGYRTEQAAAIRLDAVRLDARRIGTMLRERFCSRLADPGMNVVASVRRGETLWLVIAERPADAAASAAARDAAAGVESAHRQRSPDGATSDLAGKMLELVNAARAQSRSCGGTRYAAAPPLRYSQALEVASTDHARDMASRGYFDHDTPEGVTPTDRLAQTGYAWSLTGENIARGGMSPEEAMHGWLASPGHCANIMDQRFTEMGFGLAAADGREGDLYWVQTFAAPRGEPSPR